MTINYKQIEALGPTDLELHPVWEFANDQEIAGDTVVRPVSDIPVRSLENRIVGTQVRLANGTKLWAMLGNIDLASWERTYHFRTISIFHDTHWFSLARYHDQEYDSLGPSALAAFLGMRKEGIFPIVYDIRSCCDGDQNVLVDQIDENPKRRLTEAEIIEMAIS